ncbi:MAG: hypothetical protein EOO52_12945 [Gammaproteobacteria bacterium]|nr:MAG: hypothetical protein EOO52_12945 [Gammaproteobacteria bacterium]
MGWSNAVNYLRKHVLRNEYVATVQNRKDINLPWDVRIGSLLSWQISPFLKAQSARSIIRCPETTRGTISAISRLHYKDFDDGKQYRLYLNCDDNDTNETFIHVFTDNNGEPKEAIYCRMLTRFYPESNDEQVAFTGEEGHGLGDPTYELSYDTLAQIGYSEDELSIIFSGTESLSYSRAFKVEEAAHVQPFSGREIRIDDENGDRGLAQEILYMPYYRRLEELDEYLLISTEHVTSRNGDPSSREIHVDFMVGILLDLERLIVQ